MRCGGCRCLSWTAWALLAAGAVLAQGVDVSLRPVARIAVEGVRTVDPQLVHNQIRLQAGRPYDSRLVSQDIENITRLGRFSRVQVRVDPNPDGSVNVTYEVNELPVIREVMFSGNQALKNDKLREAVSVRGGDAQDTFLIERARDQIIQAYHQAGYYLVSVEVDNGLLNREGILLMKIREGPRVRVRRVRFEGNAVFPDVQLDSKVKTRTASWLRKGVLYDETLDQDVVALRNFYRERGYLDVRVGHKIELSDDQRDAAVTFLIEEGPEYHVNTIRFEGHTVFPEAQLLSVMDLTPGGVFSQDRIRRSQQRLSDLYGKLGYIETRIDISRVFQPGTPTVDVLVSIQESGRSLVGAILIRGNATTQDKVVRRQIRNLEPGKPYDSTGLQVSERHIRETGLFSEAKMTILGKPEDDVRDLLIEVKEAPSGSMSFGASISSDNGVFGAFDITQRNFDINDPPESLDEFFAGPPPGQAYRGAGQFFRLELQPGNQFQRYRIIWNEPFFQDSDWFLNTQAFIFDRIQEKWEEDRRGITLGLGKRFGDVWSASAQVRFESVDVHDLEADAPVDAFAVNGKNDIDSVGLYINYNTTDSRVFPTRGTRIVFGAEHVGWISNDFSYTKLTAEMNMFWTMDEDFLGRKSVLSLRVESGIIFPQDEAPLFERFYAGGHNSFRGFARRGVGPRGIRADTLTVGDDPVGGDFMFLAGLEYNYPLMENTLRGVWFVDTGTVLDDHGFEDYRVSVGAGIRLQLPFAGQMPFAFDLAWPVLKEKGDEDRVFSFNLGLPY